MDNHPTLEEVWAHQVECHSTNREAATEVASLQGLREGTDGLSRGTGGVEETKEELEGSMAQGLSPAQAEGQEVPEGGGAQETDGV